MPGVMSGVIPGEMIFSLIYLSPYWFTITTESFRLPKAEVFKLSTEDYGYK
jgi:hypothetical protein